MEEAMSIDKNAVKKERGNRQGNILIWVLILLLALFIYEEFKYYYEVKNFNWLYLVSIIEIALLMVFWFKVKLLRRVIGEDGHTKRSKVQLSLIFTFIMILIIPLVIYETLNNVNTIQTIEPLSILVVSPTLGGLVLAFTALTTKIKKVDLFAVAQKFIITAIMFVIFTPSMYLVEFLKINPAIPDMSNPSINIIGGIYFWIATPAFYIGIILFLWALIDLVFALLDIAGILIKDNKI
jgi:hypothetical protein